MLLPSATAFAACVALCLDPIDVVPVEARDWWDAQLSGDAAQRVAWGPGKRADEGTGREDERDGSCGSHISDRGCLIMICQWILICLIMLHNHVIN